MVKPLQFRFCQRTYTFTFKIGFFVACLILCGLFYSLGVWQLHRYYFKKNLLDTYQSHLSLAPQPLLNLTGTMDSWQFKNVTVAGHYLNVFTMLLQNQFYKDQIGYDVLTPLEIPGSKKLLLVDRGWLRKPEKTVPLTIPQVNSEQHIVGYIKLLTPYSFILGKNILDTNASPLMMQRIDTTEMSQILHREFYPFVLRLSASQPYGFVRDWTISTVLPERHMGYAIQWFAMACVLMLAYLGFCLERVDKKGIYNNAK